MQHKYFCFWSDATYNSSFAVSLHRYNITVSWRTYYFRLGAWA